MDIRQLSTEACEAVLHTAEAYDEELVAHFGFLAETANDEAEFLEKSATLAGEIMQFDEEELEDLLNTTAPDRTSLREVLERMIVDIRTVSAIPLARRTFPPALPPFSSTSG